MVILKGFRALQNKRRRRNLKLRSQTSGTVAICVLMFLPPSMAGKVDVKALAGHHRGLREYFTLSESQRRRREP